VSGSIFLHPSRQHFWKRESGAQLHTNKRGDPTLGYLRLDLEFTESKKSNCITDTASVLLLVTLDLHSGEVYIVLWS
jgi:hypothetical protein